MEYVEVPVKVSKESYELGMALAKLVMDIRMSLKDGFQVGTDLPVIIASFMSKEVAAGVQGLDKIAEELKENKAAFAMALGLAAEKIIEDMK